MEGNLSFRKTIPTWIQIIIIAISIFIIIGLSVPVLKLFSSLASWFADMSIQEELEYIVAFSIVCLCVVCILILASKYTNNLQLPTRMEINSDAGIEVQVVQAYDNFI